MVAPAICAGGIAAIAVLKGASNATGNVIFTETEKGVHVTGTVSVAAAMDRLMEEVKAACCAAVVQCCIVSIMRHRTAPNAHRRHQ